MDKISAPVALGTLNEQTLPVYYETFRQCRIQRVVICAMGPIYSPDCHVYRSADKVRSVIRYFQERGLEVTIWIGGFGHGAPLFHQAKAADYLEECEYTPIEGVDGGGTRFGYCPADERFAADYARGVQALAAMHPDAIMLDDDFRLNSRNYNLGCFCPIHLKRFRELVGEDVPRERLEKLIFSGGKNKYRSAYLKMSAETMLGFAGRLRRAVDEVAPDVRLGSCAVMESWDFSGTDQIAIAKAFAGSTKPFLRTIGAPYWQDKLADVIEKTRLQLHWCENAGVEVFTEGDTYPRPRYLVPSAKLELYDMALLADGHADGIQKYMFDYRMNPGYETGYTDRHIRNLPFRDWVNAHFAGKKPVGVQVIHPMHQVEDWEFSQIPEKLANKLIGYFAGNFFMLLSQNGIPTTFDPGAYPAAIFGECARTVTGQAFVNGAILDVAAAQILEARGFDTGLAGVTQQEVAGEFFLSHQEEIFNVDNGGLKGLQCKPGAQVLSTFTPTGACASYFYENSAGQKFFVLGCDFFNSRRKTNYYASYYRQEQLIEIIPRLCGKRLPASCQKNPDLYILTAADENAMSVLLLNIYPDTALAPRIQLDKVYTQITFQNCSGSLSGDQVLLSDLPPYGMAAFAVR